METEYDLRMELQAINRISKLWKCTAVKLPEYSQLDFALTRSGQIMAFAEVKCRTFQHKRYKTSLLHLHKMMYARQVSFETNIPTFLIVCWTDRLGFCNFNVDFQTTIGGRTDRGIERDFGLMAEISIEKFKFV